MTKPLSLKLNGKPFSLQRTKPSALLIKEYLDKSPADELFTTSELSTRCGVSSPSDYFKEVPAHTLKVGSVRYWGAPKAIAELRKQVSQ